jgi:hypothetical protein
LVRLIRKSPAPNPAALDALFGIVQDSAAGSEVRRKAARKIAEYLLPKTGRKEKALPDEYGFSIKPSLAISYRDIALEMRALRALMSDPRNRPAPAREEMFKKLQARSAAIRARLEAPSPMRYGVREATKDHVRVLHFYSLRDNGIALTEAQNAEDALAKVRMDMHSNGPEEVERRRRQTLEDAKRIFRNLHAEPLSRKQKIELLRRIYPELSSDLSQIGDNEFTFPDHPFPAEQPPEAPPISPAGPSDGPATDQIQSAGPAKIGQDSL